MAYLDIFLFALVAIFIGYRLWAVLGTHDPDKPIRKKNTFQGEEVGAVVRRQRQSERPKTQPVSADGFDEDRFLQGAQMAFRMILEAYSHDDKKTLEKLLSPELFTTFSATIDARQKKGHILEANLYNLTMTRVLDRLTEGHIQKVKVKFVSEQCVLVRDSQGQLVEGDPSSVEEITDIWTFSRDERSRNPNWILIETADSE